VVSNQQHSRVVTVLQSRDVLQVTPDRLVSRLALLSAPAMLPSGLISTPNLCRVDDILVVTKQTCRCDCMHNVDVLHVINTVQKLQLVFY
jgi:hypothetical protein